MPLTIPSAQQYPWDAPLSKHLAQLNDPTYGGMNSWAVTPTVGVDGLALGVNHRGYTGINTSSANIEQWNGTNWVALIDSAKLVTTPSLNLYVNQTTGSDANNGQSATTAWKTTSKLYQELRAYSFQDREINIYLGPGLYTLRFPNNTTQSQINVIGESSATVKLATMIFHDQVVTIKGLTISYPGLTTFATLIQCLGGGMLKVGSDIVLGEASTSVIYFYIRGGGRLSMYANSPLTVTHNCGAVMYLYGDSWATFHGFAAPGAGNTGTVPPPTSPGVSYTNFVGPLVSGETMSNINFVGTRTVNSGVIVLLNGSKIEGTTDASLRVSGTVTGPAYQLTAGSYINSSTVSGQPTANSIGFSSSLSAGIIDATSYVVGTRNV